MKCTGLAKKCGSTYWFDRRVYSARKNPTQLKNKHCSSSMDVLKYVLRSLRKVSSSSKIANILWNPSVVNLSQEICIVHWTRNVVPVHYIHVQVLSLVSVPRHYQMGSLTSWNLGNVIFQSPKRSFT